ncbi:EamA family transporter [Streptomyces sp. NPDC020780]|uniref:EamA family transporter n=1 Tax=unclassified Streptomyces TaxID=2593676 RepID=UPI0037A89C03
MALIGEGLPGALSERNVAGFAYLGVVGALFAYVFRFRGVERLPALTVSVLGFASPLAATALGCLVRGGTLSPVQLASAVAVVAAVPPRRATDGQAEADGEAGAARPAPRPVRKISRAS